MQLLSPLLFLSLAAIACAQPTKDVKRMPIFTGGFTPEQIKQLNFLNQVFNSYQVAPGFSTFIEDVKSWERLYLVLETEWVTTLGDDTIVTDKLAGEFREAIIKGQQNRLTLLLQNEYARKEVQDVWVETQKEVLALFKVMDMEADKEAAARAAWKAAGSVESEPVTTEIAAAEGATVTAAGEGVAVTAVGESAAAKATEIAASSEEARSTPSTTQNATASESTGEAETEEEVSAASQGSSIGALAVGLVAGLAAFFVL